MLATIKTEKIEHGSPYSAKKQLVYPTSSQQVAPVKIKEENYDINDLRSDDETDDEEEPSKPIPQWARDPFIFRKAQAQCFKTLNFTKMFRAACNAEIKLEEVFSSRRRRFVERSSSANWNTPPVWGTNGICGEESFLQIRKN